MDGIQQCCYECREPILIVKSVILYCECPTAYCPACARRQLIRRSTSPYIQLITCPCCNTATCEVDLCEMMLQIDKAMEVEDTLLVQALSFHKLTSHDFRRVNADESASIYIKLIEALQSKPHELLLGIVVNGKDTMYLRRCVLRAEMYRQGKLSRFAPCRRMLHGMSLMNV